MQQLLWSKARMDDQVAIYTFPLTVQCVEAMTSTLITNYESYSYLSTLSLPTPCFLHHKAVNPALDVVLLHRPATNAVVARGMADLGKSPAELKKEKELNARGKVCLSLWRVNGCNGCAWEVEVSGGTFSDLAWATNGE